MARGMANNEPIVSQARTKEFEEGYERTFGDKPIERGRWVWDAERKELVRAEDYRPPDRAVDAPVMVGRFYENMTTAEGEDIGSREKYRRYMREKGVTNMSDYSPGWYERNRAEKKRAQDKSRRETIARTVYTDPRWKP